MKWLRMSYVLLLQMYRVDFFKVLKNEGDGMYLRVIECVYVYFLVNEMRMMCEDILADFMGIWRLLELRMNVWF